MRNINFNHGFVWTVNKISELTLISFRSCSKKKSYECRNNLTHDQYINIFDDKTSGFFLEKYIIFILFQGLQAIRCPAGLYFDIEKQTCDWKAAVKNCKLKNKERKVKPLLFTDEPLCQVCMGDKRFFFFFYIPHSGVVISISNHCWISHTYG